MPRPDDLTLRELHTGNAVLAKELAERRDLCRIGRVMHAIKTRLVQSLERLCRGDIRRDHEFLDQAVAVEPLPRLDARDLAAVVELDAALWQVEIERATLTSRAIERGESAIEGAQHRLEQRRGVIARLRSDRLLHLFVSKARRGAHQPANETVAVEVAIVVEPKMDGHASAIDARFQRTKLVRQRLGQHRYHAIGEVNRIAALLGLAIQRIVRSYVPGDIGDRDDRVPTILLFGIALGPDRVVEIARIGAVDGNERDRAQIIARG